MARRLICLIAIVVGLSTAFPVMGGQVDAGGSQAAATGAVFSRSDRQLISNYFLRHDGYLDELPPGVRKQLVTKGRLPPGIARKVLPRALADALSPAQAGYDRMIVGPDVLLVEIATGIIADIIRDVVR